MLSVAILGVKRWYITCSTTKVSKVSCHFLSERTMCDSPESMRTSS